MRGLFSSAGQVIGPTVAGSTAGSVTGSPHEVLGGDILSIFIPSSGTPSGNILLEASMDNGTTWYTKKTYSSYPVLDRVPRSDPAERNRLKTDTGWTGTSVPVFVNNDIPRE